MKALNIILFLLVLFLFGCGGKEIALVPAPDERPPDALLADCQMTELTEMKTNAEILISLQTVYLDFKECNRKKKILRGWYDEREKLRQEALRKGAK